MLQCDVIGNLGYDAEVKEIGGKNYVSFDVAHSYMDKQGKSTTWVSVLIYGDGGSLLQYLKKGCKVFVRGREKVSTYKDRNGNAQVSISVMASEVQLCGFRESQKPSAQSEQVDDMPFFQ